VIFAVITFCVASQRVFIVVVVVVVVVVYFVVWLSPETFGYTLVLCVFLAFFSLEVML
jgi:hypothetical protein